MKKDLSIKIPNKYVVDRGTAHELLESASTDTVIDFAEVKFASRSFVDELLSQIEKRSLVVQFINVKTNVSAMIRLVKSQRENPESYKEKNKIDFEVVRLGGIKV